MRFDSAIGLAFALVLSACVRHRTHAEPSTSRGTTPIEPRDESAAAPLVADFPAPTLSPETRAAWDVYAQRHCSRIAERPPTRRDCKPHGHVTPCSARSFETEFEQCDGAFACLKVAEQARACARCDIDVPDEIVRARIGEVSGDCAGLLRFVDGPRTYDTEQLVDMARGAAAIECLAKSTHPRAWLLLGRWSRTSIAAEALVGDPQASRALLRDQLFGSSAGRDDLVDSWAPWGTFDALGAAADPLLPAVRALAVRGDHDAIRRLGTRKDREAISILRRLLRDHTDWRAQELAAESLAEIGIDAVATAPALDDVARDHWSTDVRDAATWAAARVRGEGPSTRPEATWGEGEWPHDELCPIDSVRLSADELSSGGMWQERWPWMTKIGSETITLPDPHRPRPTLPKDLPKIDLLERFPDVSHPRRPLHDVVTVVRSVRSGWLVGTDGGEWTGALWWFDRRGRVRHLVTGNIKDIVEIGGELYAIEGLAHLGSSTGSLVHIHVTRRDVRARTVLELPGDAQAWWVRGDELWMGTFQGLFIIDRDFHIRAQPCHADETYPGDLDDDQIARTFARVRPIVGRCLESLPADLPCGGDYEPKVAITFRVDAAGSVIAAEPFDFFEMRFPEAEACIATHALDWDFPAPKGGAALFAYAFTRRGD